MFKKIKESITTARERKELLYTAITTLLNDAGEFYRLQSEVLEQTKAMNEAFCPEDTKDFIKNINEFMNNPQLSDDFYKQIVAYGHKEQAPDNQ